MMNVATRGVRVCRTIAVPLLYLLLMIGGYAIIVIHVHPVLPNDYLSERHITTACLTIITCLASFISTSRSNPGIITTDTHASFRQYTSHAVLFPQETPPCTTCLVTKIPRSKHCRTCNVCVARFHHHCIWLNNCIGANNTGTFLSFLLVHLVTCCYGVYLLTGVLMVHTRAAQRASLLHHQRSDTTSELLTQVMTLREHQPMVMLLAICGVSYLLLFVFFLSQIVGLATNQTANESHKRALAYDQLRRISSKDTNDRRAQASSVPDLDLSWGGIVPNRTSTQALHATTKRTLRSRKATTMATNLWRPEDIEANPWKRTSMWKNICDGICSTPRQKIKNS